MPIPKVRKLGAQDESGKNRRDDGDKYKLEQLNKGFTKLEANRCRWDTLLELLLFGGVCELLAAPSGGPAVSE